MRARNTTTILRFPVALQVALRSSAPNRRSSSIFSRRSITPELGNRPARADDRQGAEHTADQRGIGRAQERRAGTGDHSAENGRAACRGRGEESVVGGCFKKKDK